MDVSGFGGGSGKTEARGSRTLPEDTRKNLNEALQAMDAEVDDNLDEMSAQLRRLQGLGTALGSEIAEQNTLLDDITGTVRSPSFPFLTVAANPASCLEADAMNSKVRDQDKQMKKILGHKPASAAAKLDPASAAAIAAAKLA